MSPTEYCIIFMLSILNIVLRLFFHFAGVVLKILLPGMMKIVGGKHSMSRATTTRVDRISEICNSGGTVIGGYHRIYF